MKSEIQTTTPQPDLIAGLVVRDCAGHSIAGTRLDLGWTAWLAARPLQAGRWRRLRFLLALWRHLGQAHYFVQVDDQYRVATSVRLRWQAGEDLIRVQLLQADGPWQWLWRRLRRDPTLDLTLTGRRVQLARLPADAKASVPDVMTAAGQGGCAEALLDQRLPCSLPLVVSAR